MKFEKKKRRCIISFLTINSYLSFYLSHVSGCSDFFLVSKIILSRTQAPSQPTAHLSSYCVIQSVTLTSSILAICFVKPPGFHSQDLTETVVSCSHQIKRSFFNPHLVNTPLFQILYDFFAMSIILIPYTPKTFYFGFPSTFQATHVSFAEPSSMPQIP